ncbi:MAG: M3 family oligoendopeptidase [Pseudomonadota bacterium]|nr:M3 family oligoendopeptidase [Pseudomonadota bacterium]MDE3037303.1 M3 family oligoendopeptidase [Pseudomonadota bacterium]
MSAGKKPVRLPEWNLRDLYEEPDGLSVVRDFQRLEKLCGDFKKAYDGKVAALPAEALAGAIADYETIQELIGKLGSYAQLAFAKNMSDAAIARFYQNTQEKITTLSSRILFFTLSINTIDDNDLAEKLRNPSLQKFAPWLRDVRAFRPYQLSEALEKLLHEKTVAGVSAWIRLFDESIAALRFRVGNKNLTEPEVFNLLSKKDPAARKKAALSIGKVLASNAKLFALITNTLAKDKDIEDRWRGFKAPISSRNVANYIEDKVVDALLIAVRKNYPKLSHRYYALKAKWFGKKQLDYWDRNAPLPGDADRTYGWNEAKELVLTSYGDFSPEMAAIGRQFFDKPWIDALPSPGKSPGAFAHPTVPSAHPYLLMNFLGKSRDVMTLAHELGHGVHQVLSGRQGALMCDTPLTLAETASVFGEQLAFREMVRREKNAVRRKRLIASKVEDMLNTVVRQVAFCEFEKRLHAERKDGEVAIERICRIWMSAQAESLGPAVKLHGDYRYFWTYIPHFIHSPFYVYAYAFGDCLVNSLYAAYQSGRLPDFEKKYLIMLEAGGTLRHKELLTPFGLDAGRPDFWQQGLNVIAGMIDELE